MNLESEPPRFGNPDSAKKQQALKDEWKKITKPLEKEKEKPLRFLRYFLMANYVIKNEKGESVIYDDKIYDWFIDKDNAALCDYARKPFEFVWKVIRNVEHYLNFTNGLGNDGKPSLAMDSLKRLVGGAFSLHYVLLLAAAPLPKPLFDHFVTQLESFLFYYIFTKTPTKDLEKSFSTWADELRAIAAVGNAAAQQEKINAFVLDRFQSNMDGKAYPFAGGRLFWGGRRDDIGALGGATIVSTCVMMDTIDDGGSRRISPDESG